MDYFFYCYRERKDIYDYYFVEVLCLIYEEAEYQYKSISIYNKRGWDKYKDSFKNS